MPWGAYNLVGAAEQGYARGEGSRGGHAYCYLAPRAYARCHSEVPWEVLGEVDMGASSLAVGAARFQSFSEDAWYVSVEGAVPKVFGECRVGRGDGCHDMVVLYELRAMSLGGFNKRYASFFREFIAVLWGTCVPHG